jgi:hypothetical protein
MRAHLERAAALALKPRAAGENGRTHA